MKNKIAGKRSVEETAYTEFTDEDTYDAGLATRPLNYFRPLRAKQRL